MVFPNREGEKVALHLAASRTRYSLSKDLPHLFFHWTIDSMGYLDDYPPERWIYALTGLWHGCIAKYALFSPFHLLRYLSPIRPIAYVSTDLCRWMGGLHIGLALLALQGFLEPVHRLRQRTGWILCLVRRGGRCGRTCG